MSSVSLTKEQTIPNHERNFPPVQQDGWGLGWKASNHNTNNDPTNYWDHYQEEVSCASSNTHCIDTYISFFLSSLLKNITQMTNEVESTIYFEGRAPGMLTTLSAISMMTLIFIDHSNNSSRSQALQSH